ncbi:MAG: hypothetical protein PWR13_603 [Archaeoglobi archaeon]|nr:winged helix-turn-helix domain-containing protein [Candidatus Mnemosynella bozhongmuii]MDI3502642.1 hypothetical protein [Archaeoglobi archaeon]MDK2781575.1 hypothetical protein [Archaeoglobi archaeon]
MAEATYDDVEKIIEEFPPSTKKIFEVLRSKGPMTQKDLINETSLSPRTVRHAIQRLKEKGLIIEKFYFKDARQRLYCPSKN